MLLPEIIASINKLAKSPPKKERLPLLDDLADFVAEKARSGKAAKLHFICTHNSRRSQIAQVWAAALATHFGLEQVETFSGGTEATAFAPPAISALEQVGFQINIGQGDNPKVVVKYAEKLPPLECFSKTIDDQVNPDSDFAAVMTCSAAEVNCPYVPGAAGRFALTFEDPKQADGTPQIEMAYQETVKEIGSELLYVFSKGKSEGIPV